MALTPEQVNEIIEELRKNPDIQYSDLARRYGVGNTTIPNTLKRNGIVLPARRGAYVFPCNRFLKIKQTAVKNGYVFDIDKQYLHDLYHTQNGKCAYTGWPLTFDSKSKSHDGTASLDRIDSTKGYIEGNVHWVHKHINAMKLWHTPENFLELCRAVVRHSGKNESTQSDIDRVINLPAISTNKWRETRKRSPGP